MLPFVKLSEGYNPQNYGGRFGPLGTGLGHSLRWVMVAVVVVVLGAVAIGPLLGG